MLPSKWSQGNSLADFPCFLASFSGKYSALQLQVDWGNQKSTRQLPPRRQLSLRCRDFVSVFHLVSDSYNILPNAKTFSACLETLSGMLTLLKNNIPSIIFIGNHSGRELYRERKNLLLIISNLL